MLNLPLPQRTFFSFAAACPLRDQPPKIDGNLRDWDQDLCLPDLMGVEGRPTFAQVWSAWDDEALYFALEIKKKSRYKILPSDYWEGDCFELWLDTRDLKDGHRGNRYCYHFYFLPGGSGRDGKKPIGRQTSIDGAREQAPPFSEDLIEVGLRRLKRSYQMEIRLAAVGLNGFQPREFNRLGFNYTLHDVEHGNQSWSVGREHPTLTDPSAWGTLELQSN